MQWQLDSGDHGVPRVCCSTRAIDDDPLWPCDKRIGLAGLFRLVQGKLIICQIACFRLRAPEGGRQRARSCPLAGIPGACARQRQCACDVRFGSVARAIERVQPRHNPGYRPVSDRVVCSLNWRWEEPSKPGTPWHDFPSATPRLSMASYRPASRRRSPRPSRPIS